MRVAMVGAGYVAWSRGVFRDFGHTVVCVDTAPEKIAALNEGRIPIYEPGLDALVAENMRQSRLSFTTDLAGRSPGPMRCSSRSARRRAARRLCRSLLRLPGGARYRRSGHRADRRRHQVHRAGRHRRRGRAHRPRGAADIAIAVASNPNSSARARQSPTSSARPGSSSRRRPAGGGDGERALPPALPQPRADPGDEPAHRRIDQVRAQCLPRHQDHLHQRDRGSLRAGRPDCRRSPAASGSTTASAASSCMPARAMAARAFPRTLWRWSRLRRMRAARAARRDGGGGQ